jgi:hypothetical protein
MTKIQRITITKQCFSFEKGPLKAKILACEF